MAAVVTAQVERCPGSRSFAGLSCRSTRVKCRVCDGIVPVVQHEDGGPGAFLAVHDREVTR